MIVIAKESQLSKAGVWGVPNKQSEPPQAVKRGTGCPKGYPVPLLA